MGSNRLQRTGSSLHLASSRVAGDTALRGNHAHPCCNSHRGMDVRIIGHYEIATSRHLAHDFPQKACQCLYSGRRKGEACEEKGDMTPRATRPNSDDRWKHSTCEYYTRTLITPTALFSQLLHGQYGVQILHVSAYNAALTDRVYEQHQPRPRAYLSANSTRQRYFLRGCRASVPIWPRLAVLIRS